MSRVVFELRLEPFAGSHIREAAAQAIDIAERLGVIAMFDFNGVACMARPGDDAAGLVAAWEKQLERGEGSYRLAVSPATGKGLPVGDGEDEEPQGGGR